MAAIDFQQGIRYDAHRRSFTYNRVRLPGLHKVIKAAFFAKYSYKKAEKLHLEEKKLLRGGGLSKSDAMLQGTRVDDELTDIARCCRVFESDLRLFLDDKHPLPRCSDEAMIRIKSLRLDMHRYTRNILKAIHADGLVPYWSQVPVCFLEPIRVATAVDLVCFSAAELHHSQWNVSRLQPTIFEVKTGHDRHYEWHAGNLLSAPFGGEWDSPMNQHHIQLVMTVWMFEATRRRVDKDSPLVRNAFVIRAHNEGVNSYPLRQWAGLRDKNIQTTALKAIWIKTTQRREKKPKKKRVPKRQAADHDSDGFEDVDDPPKKPRRQ